MTRLLQSLREVRDDDRGSVAVFTVVVAVALLVVIGLVVDGGGQIRNLQKADTAAQEAGRAAGQAVNSATLARGDGGQVNPADAATAARAYLQAAGVQGTVAVTSPTTLEITTTTTYNTLFLGLIGVGSLPASGDSQVRLVRELGGER